mmetsp:Transcript_9979/g.27869  ORF Transcript_9979/g.27869 Transcript_9979/m.27869 type:complete len:226 (-) Transcript_9979:1647-2324(-)
MQAAVQEPHADLRGLRGPPRRVHEVLPPHRRAPGALQERHPLRPVAVGPRGGPQRHRRPGGGSGGHRLRARGSHGAERGCPGGSAEGGLQPALRRRPGGGPGALAGGPRRGEVRRQRALRELLGAAAWRGCADVGGLQGRAHGPLLAQDRGGASRGVQLDPCRRVGGRFQREGRATVVHPRLRQPPVRGLRGPPFHQGVPRGLRSVRDRRTAPLPRPWHHLGTVQ